MTSSEHSHFESLPHNLPEADKEKIKKAGKILLYLIAILFLIGWVPRQFSRIKARREVEKILTAAPVVDIVKPKRASSAGDRVLPAEVHAFQETSLYPRVNGYLKRYFVDIGDHVTTNQLLAEIDAPELDAELAQAGGTLQQIQSAYTRAHDENVLAEATLKRYEGFAKAGGVTQQQLEEKRVAVRQSHAAVEGAKANIVTAEANVQRLTELKGFKKIVAPFDGTVTVRAYDVGALLTTANVNPGKEIFKIAQTDTLKVFINVPQSYVAAAAIGQPASFIIRNFPGREFSGTITRTAGALDPATRTLNTEIDIPNPKGELLAGMYGEVKLKNIGEQPLLIPTSALIIDADGTRVGTFVEGKVTFKNVTLGRDFGTDIEVTTGLNDQENVITNPGLRMVEGGAVQVVSQKEAKS